MDIAYLFRHSEADDLELRYSLRSVAKFLPWIRKVFVFGDRPAFLTDDRSVMEHVPWESVAWVGGFDAPVTNWFLQVSFASFWPGLSDEFLVIHDDHVLLGDVSDGLARRQRVVEDLAECRERGRGKWKAQLWRTYDFLREHGFPTFNFETLTPRHMTKRRVFEAYAAFREQVSEDRFGGLLGPTAVLNHALQRENFPVTRRDDENLTIGFTDGPAIHDDLVLRTRGKKFLYFNEKGFSADLRQFLDERFPEPCPYEAEWVKRQSSVAIRRSVAPAIEILDAMECSRGQGRLRDEANASHGDDEVASAAGVGSNASHGNDSTTKFDVVYLLAKSKWNQELRYSLRSFERFFPQMGTVWIVGYLPDYIDPATVRHVPEPELFRPGVFVESAAMRVLNDQLDGLTEDYVLAQDDNYLLRPVTIDDFGPFLMEDLDTVKVRSHTPWGLMLWRTYDLLKFMGFPGQDYECHTPIHLNRSQFRDVAARFIATEAAAQHRYHGICLRSAYMNILKNEAIPPRYAETHRAGFAQAADALTVEQIQTHLAGRTFFFHDDAGLTPAMKSLLPKLYPTKSSFERFK